MKIEAITGGRIGNMSIFGCSCCGPSKTEILRISDTDLRGNYEVCVRALNDALRRLPEGYYLLVQHDTGEVSDFWVGKRRGASKTAVWRVNHKYGARATVPSRRSGSVVSPP
jgi:hypothetical protein